MMAARRQGRYRLEGLEVDPRRRLCLLHGEELILNSAEFDLLEYLVRNPHREIPEAELTAGILPTDEDGMIPLEKHLERLQQIFSQAADGKAPLQRTEDGGALLDAEVIFEPEIWADSAPIPEEVVAPGYAPYLTGEEEAEVVEGRRKLTAQERARLQRMGLILAASALAILGAWGAWQWTHRPRPNGMKAVLSHLQDRSGLLGETLDTAERLELEQSPFLELETPEQVRAALQAGKTTAQTQTVDAAAARRACQRRGADVYLAGELRRVGTHVVVSLEARDCGTNQKRAHSEGIAEDAAGVIAILRPVTEDLRLQLGERRSSVKRTSKALSSARDVAAALGNYAAADRLAAAGQTNAAIVAMQKAADGGLVLAQVALSRLYDSAGQPELAAASLRQAYDARNDLPANQVYAVKTAFDERVSQDLNAALEDAKVWGASYPLDARPQQAQTRIELQLGAPEAALEPAWKALELDDESVDTYALLAEAQLDAGRVEEAAGTVRLAVTHGLENERLHQVAYSIAVARRDDASLQAERKWADGKPAAAGMHMLDARREFAAGKVRDAEADAAAAIELWRAVGMVGEADRQTAELAAMEARLGLTATASATLKGLPEMVGNAPLALALAETGELEKATSAMQEGLSTHPSGTLWQQVWAPEIGAAIALAEDKPDAAVDALRKSVGYELRSLDIILLRAQAYLGEKQPELAEMEYRKLLAHPFDDPLNVDHMLAQLGLAQALAAEGRQAEAATEYMMLERSTLAGADADLPALRTARAEEAKLSEEARTAAKSAVQSVDQPVQTGPGLRLPKPSEH